MPVDTGLDVEAIRRDFPILQSVIHDKHPLVYLDNASSTQRPRAVIDHIVEVYEKLYANVHRGVHWLSEQSTDLYEETREKVRQFINAESTNEIIFTTGATSAINLVARSWGDANVKEGDEIIVTLMEHHSNIVPWQQLAERVGCIIRFAPIFDDARLDMDALAGMINNRTRLIAATAISNVTGVINPVAEIVRLAHDAGAVVVVDGAQSAPHEPLDVSDWGTDFVAFSGHKMLSPSGVGVLYGREHLLEAMPPFMGGGSMIREVTTEGFTVADLPAKFEAGTPPIVPALGLGQFGNRMGEHAFNDDRIEVQVGFAAASNRLDDNRPRRLDEQISVGLSRQLLNQSRPNGFPGFANRTDTMGELVGHVGRSLEGGRFQLRHGLHEQFHSLRRRRGSAGDSCDQSLCELTRIRRVFGKQRQKTP